MGNVLGTISVHCIWYTAFVRYHASLQFFLSSPVMLTHCIYYKCITKSVRLQTASRVVEWRAPQESFPEHKLFGQRSLPLFSFAYLEKMLSRHFWMPEQKKEFAKKSLLSRQEHLQGVAAQLSKSAPFELTRILIRIKKQVSSLVQ